MAIFLSKSNLVEKPPIPEQTKKHLPKVKKKEGEDKKDAAPKVEAKPEEKPQEQAKPEEKPKEQATKDEAKPQEEPKSENNSDKKD